MAKETLPPFEWLMCVITGAILIITHIIILRKFKSNSSKFTTKSLRIFSFFCILSGLMYGISMVLEPFPISCKISVQISSAVLGVQSTFMGFYQLSRLYYCFAQDKVHSNKGYPNYLFFIMYTVGLLILLSAIVIPWIYSYDTFSIPCGINSQYEQYPKHINPAHYVELGNVLIAVYWIWDLTTLLLYTVKVMALHKFITNAPKLRHVYSGSIQNPKNVAAKTTDSELSTRIESRKEVDYRIMNILVRVIILTLFYEIWFVISLFVAPLYVESDNEVFWVRMLYYVIWSISSMSISYSIFMMNDNNAYIWFLSIINKSGIIYVCCCCKSVMRKQLDLELPSKPGKSDTTSNRTTKDIDTSNKHVQVNIDVGANDDGDMTVTKRDNSVKESHSPVNELSRATPDV